MTPAAIIFVALVGTYTATAAVFDMRMHRIPNYITVPAALLGFAYHAFMPGGFGLLSAVGGFAIGFVLLLLPWMLGGGGAGDVKLLAALGAWLGPMLMLVAFAMSVMLACLVAIGLLTYRACTEGFGKTKQRFFESAKPTDGRRGNKPNKRRVLPFAVPVALSTWCLLGWVVLQKSL